MQCVVRIRRPFRYQENGPADVDITLSKPLDVNRSGSSTETSESSSHGGKAGRHHVVLGAGQASPGSVMISWAPSRRRQRRMPRRLARGGARGVKHFGGSSGVGVDVGVGVGIVVSFGRGGDGGWTRG